MNDDCVSPHVERFESPTMSRKDLEREAARHGLVLVAKSDVVVLEGVYHVPCDHEGNVYATTDYLRRGIVFAAGIHAIEAAVLSASCAAYGQRDRMEMKRRFEWSLTCIRPGALGRRGPAAAADATSAEGEPT